MSLKEEKIKRFDDPRSWLVAVLCIAYMLWAYFKIGIRTDHFILAGFVFASWLATSGSRKFIIAFAALVIYWIIYDSMRVFPNYLFNKVSIEGIYQAEKAVFGISTAQGVLTPNEYLATKQNALFDITTALLYLNWVTIPFFMAFYFWIKDKRSFLHFSYVFFLANFIGFIIYYLFPAAPPWYYAEYGNVEHFNILGNPAGLINFDVRTGLSLFSDMYAVNPNVFAAMPSLHSAFPVVVLAFGIRERMGWWNLLFLIHGFGIWFSAVYLDHHYVLDVLMGIICSISAFLIFQYGILKTGISPLIDKLAMKI